MAHSGPPSFLDEALQSIEGQVYRDFEVLVVDDGAGLDWDFHLRGVRFPCRVLRSSERRGLAISLNCAAHAASGALFARMDSDDVSAPSRLGLQVAFVDAQPTVALVGAASRLIDERGRALGRSYPLTEPEDLAVALAIYNQLCHGSVLFRREAFELAGGYDESVSVAQDYELWLRALRAGHRLANLPQPVYGLRLHAQSVSSRSRAVQSAVARRLRSRVSAQDWSDSVVAWFEAGRARCMGRPYESLQLGRLAVLFLAATAARPLEWAVRRELLRFAARHAAPAARLLVSEAGWRHRTVAKVSSLLTRV